MDAVVEVFAALIPPIVMAGFFFALVATVMRATDWRRDVPEGGVQRASRNAAPATDAVVKDTGGGTCRENSGG